MITFKDYYQNNVKLSFTKNPFSKQPKHVWVITKYKHQWLLTKHKDRGLEFPGGKVEEGEKAEDAAEREVYEETGGIISNLKYIGQYFVDGKGGEVIKNVYYAEVDQLIKQPTYFETDGPVLLDTLPEDIQESSLFSFMMKDAVLPQSLKVIKKMEANSLR
ncbi:nucleoside triphosphatase YtkD [Virgibacillus sp. MSP4-1]|uniref:Nucleoside triphosphatase YtkD n=1 Tax=Salinibacillus aidingensis TaxID=237684 RepID=A0ABN1BL49_9BACI|nr:nucleoside triphosphatase YtkD [Virgibacillus sp. MSP4-1]QHS23095.1 nucleoside triphosphatase YtkD [Virgibacillus sp. MSP4-1]